ncbi:Facilitated trehalose transporter Tret1 [Gryllus bimaculatus]|nr:Facilitated trehalose transporter Tret1 [Gryllus bimaculatus]
MNSSPFDGLYFAVKAVCACVCVCWQALLVHAGRFLIGVSWGLSATIVPMYCSEIADKRCRGHLNAYVYPASVLGHVWVCALGTCLPYLWYSAACAGLPLLALAGLWWAPESPVHLAEVGRHEEAWDVVRWLRGGSPLVDPKPELEAVLAAVNALDEERTRFAWEMLAEPKIARALALCLGVQLFQLTCGVNAFVFYTTQIFEGVGIVPSGNVCSIVLTVAHFIGAVCSTKMLSRMPRRPFLLVSAVGMALGQAGFGLYSYYYRYGYDVKTWAWTPTLSIGVFYIFHSMGFGPLPGVFMGEILPAHVKPWAIPTIAFFARTVASTLAKEVPIFIDVCRHHVVFGMFFGGFSALGAIFVFFFVPETKLKSPASNKKSTESNR